MAWESVAPESFTVSPRGPQQTSFLKTAAPPGSARWKVLDEYVNAGESLWFNRYLRGAEMEKLSDKDRAELRRKTRLLNALIQEAPPARHSMVLFRGISESAPKFKTYRKGDDADFLNQGIVSTSTSFDAALDFIEDGEECCMLVILVPRGAQFLEVLDFFTAFSYEGEVLLPHGCKFVVQRASVVLGIKTFFVKMVV